MHPQTVDVGAALRAGFLPAANLPRKAVPLRQHLEEVDPGPHLDWWHVGAMIEAIQALLTADYDRLLICAPPRTWKSRIVVQGGSSCRIRNEPRSKIVIACASDTLVYDHSRRARDMVIRACGEGFLRHDSRSVVNWKTTQDGIYNAVTIEGGQLGHGADLLGVDDPFAKKKHAQSRTLQRARWASWREDLQSRLQDRPEGGPPMQFLMHQRLGSRELVGRLKERLEEEGNEEWHALILDGFRDPRPFAFPSCITMIEDRRLAGDPLCADEGVMREIKKRRETDPLLHQTIDQQRPPEDAGGGVFRASWLPIIGRGRDDLAKPHQALAAMAEAGELTALRKQVRGHDFSGGGADAVGSGGICELEPGGRYQWIIFDPTTDHPAAAAVEGVAIANAHRGGTPDHPSTLVIQATPKETGVGAAVAASVNRQLRAGGYTVHPMPVSPGKVALAQPLSAAAMPSCRLCSLPVVEMAERDVMAKGSYCVCERPSVRLGRVAILATPDGRAEALRDRMHDFDGEGEDDAVDAVCCAFNAAQRPSTRGLLPWAG